MVKKENQRVIITLTKKQVCWLKNGAKKLNISVSKFVKWLISKNISQLLAQWDPKKLDEMIKIAKLPWVDFDPSHEYEWDENLKEWR